MPVRKSSRTVVVSADANYLDVLEMYLESMGANYQEHPPIHINHRGLTPEIRHDLSSRFRDIHFIDIDEQHFPTGPGVQHEPGRHDIPLFYSRLLIWTPLFASFDVVVYMDIDTLVQGPLDDLFETTEFFAVREAYRGSNRVLYDDRAEEYDPMLESDGIDPACLETAMNAGVFAVHSSLRNQEQVALFTRLIDRYAEYFAWADQSLMSMWMYANGFRPAESYEFNFQVRLFRERIFHPEFSGARVIHFNGMAQSGRVVRTMRIVRKLTKSKFGRRILSPVFIRSQLLGGGLTVALFHRLRAGRRRTGPSTSSP